MRTYKIHAAVTSTQDNLASVLMARNGRIKSLRWAVEADMVADNAVIRLECSTRATNQLTTNESQGDIGVVRIFGNLVTSGQTQSSINKQEFLDFPVAAGERVYVHAALVTTASGVCTIHIDVDEKG